MGSGAQFHHPVMHTEILKVVRENPGLTRREIAAKLGKKTQYVDSLLWRLRKYTGALRTEVGGNVRTPGKEEFARTPAAQRMLSKLGSSKTKDPWLRRLFRYEKWLQERGYFGSVAEALEDHKNARDQERRYYHMDLLGEFLNSWKASKGTKDSIVTVIRGFYRKNRADLPREKIVYAREMLLDTPSAGEQYVKPEEWWRIINDGHVPVRDKAIMAVLLYTGMDESTLTTQFNVYAYPQLVKALDESPENWDVERGPVRINLTRPKTLARYYNFLPARGIQYLKDWLNVRQEIMGEEVAMLGEASDPIFVTSEKRPYTRGWSGG